MAKLVILTEGLTGLTHELSVNLTTVGRADGNMFQIVEPSVSGRHCEILLRGNDVVVRDLKSTNGTFIQGERITEAVLKLGQTLRLGQVDLRLKVSTPVASPAPGVPSTSVPTPASAPVPTPAGAPSTAKVTNVPSAPSAPSPRVVTPPNVSPPSPSQRLESTTDFVKGTDPNKAVPARPAGSDANTGAVSKPGNQPEPGNAPAKKHQVLFVDDNNAFLEAITELYGILGDKTWDIHRASTADQALAVLQQKAIDLVVLDIGMPVLDGVQLLNLIHQRYPGVKKAILTGSASAGDRAACLANGAELFIQKPVSSDGMKAVFTTLNELITWAHRKGFSGMLRQVGLQDVIQIECLGCNSSILEIRNQRLQGQIYIEAGTIVHAAVGTLVGEKAFYRLLSLTGGDFHLHPFKPPPERTVHGQWEFLLMEAARIHDEEATTMITKSEVTGQQTTPSAPAPSAPGTEFHAVGENVIEMTSHDGQWHPVDGSKKMP
jgi:CheY-like chemotaxis protein/pSer/pThr/pTyr-binding forkhead associated (FHA) protein